MLMLSPSLRRTQGEASAWASDTRSLSFHWLPTSTGSERHFKERPCTCNERGGYSCYLSRVGQKTGTIFYTPM